MKLSAVDLHFRYGKAPLLEGVSVGVRDRELLGLVGPNGAGKSTLLKCLYGALRPQEGRVLLKEEPLSARTASEIARLLAVVPQSCSPAYPVSVAYFVGMGRFSRERFLGGPTDHDRAVVARCLEELKLQDLANRPLDELSGGEFRRVLIAQALAQEPEILLFDEPVQQLDLLHQLEVMEFAKDFAHREGTAGIVVLHDLGLAARYCDRIAMLHGGKILATGSPEEVLTREHLRTAYDVEVSIQRCPDTGKIQIVPLSGSRSPSVS